MRILTGTALLALSMLAPQPAPAKEPEKSPWHTDFAAARAVARHDGKPLFVIFR